MRTPRTAKAMRAQEVLKVAADRPSTVAALMIVLIAPIAACTQSAPGSSPQGRNWAEIAKLPDWSGVYELEFAPQSPAELTPKAAERSKAYAERLARGENITSEIANCVPPGLIGIMAQPYPIEFLFTPGKVTIAIETHSQMRRIFTDGRSHSEDPDLFWQGNSIGRWEGDTLVVDTIGLDPAAPPGDQIMPPGLRFTDKAHVVERIQMVDDDTRIRITTTVDDPEVLLKPWTFVRNYLRHRDWDIREYTCQQNNRDAADSEGRASIRLE